MADTSIPETLRARRQWLIWKREQKPGAKKPAKMPYYANGKRRTGQQGSDTDRGALVDYATTCAAVAQHQAAGLGFAFLPGDGLIGIDLDNAVDPDTGEISQRAQRIIAACNSYTEWSPSGWGFHIYVLGETETAKDNGIGVEMFCGRQFFTVTGRHLAGTPTEVRPIAADVLRRLHKTIAEAKGGFSDKPARAGTATINDEYEKIRGALDYLSPDCGYDDWLHIGMAIHAELGESGFVLWDGWSAKSGKYPGEREMRAKWKSFKPGAITAASLYGMARAAGWRTGRAVDISTPPAPKKSSSGDSGASDPRPADSPGRFTNNGTETDFGGNAAPLSPPSMPAEGYPPLIREIVEVACANSEAHPVAVAMNAIGFFCCLIGRGVFQRIGDATIHCRPFMLIVGKSGKARKGTAEHTVREIFLQVGALLRQMLGNDDRLRVHTGGLSTGEGVAWAIRDEQEPDDAGKGGDLGVPDKRLLCIESEFAALLAHMRRESNTLSAVVRNLFDGRDMEPMTKTSRVCATRPHINIVAHVTGHELREKASENDVANGTLNRFLMAYVYRPKLVPLPEPTPAARLAQIAKRIAEAIIATAGKDLHANNTREAFLGDEARALWVDEYPRLTRDRDGRGGSLLARSEMYARMLAMVFAAMDGRLEIEPCDLRAAIAWVEYWHASVTYIFNCTDEDGSLDPFAAQVLGVITARPGVTLTGLQEHWHRKKIKQVKAALELLMNLAPPLVEQRKDDATGGRAALKFYVYGKEVI